MGGYGCVDGLNAAIKEHQKTGKISSGGPRIKALGALPWEKTGHSHTVLAHHVYGALGIEVGKTPWLDQFKKQDVIAELKNRWDELLGREGRYNHPALREVFNHRKALGDGYTANFDGEIYRFIVLQSALDTNQRFPCAILPNGRPAAVWTAMELSDEPFDVVHLSVADFVEMLHVAVGREIARGVASALDADLRHPGVHEEAPRT
jgi:hypothetical protein